MTFRSILRRAAVVAAVPTLAAGLIGGMATAPASAAHANNPTPWKSGEPQYSPIPQTPPKTGVNWHGMWEDHTPAARARLLDMYANAGVKHVRMDMRWAMLQPNSRSSYDMNVGVRTIDERLNELAVRGMKATVVFYHPPKWSSGTSAKNGEPGSFTDYANALAWAAKRWGHIATAWEMWNEPDLPDFWASGDRRKYANLIKTTYPIVKKAAPNVEFILGAPTYLGLGNNFFKDMYSYGIKGNYDAIGTHPYMSPSNLAPTANTTGSARMWSVAGIADLRALMAKYGEGHLPIYATEFGYSTHSGTSPHWEIGVSESTQGKYTLANYYELAKQGVKGAYVYMDWDSTHQDRHENNYGIIRRDFSPKPAYFALKCAASGICGPGTAAAPATAPATSPAPAPATSTAAYVPAGSSWRFNDVSTDLGTSWRKVASSDPWPRGGAEFGYGDGDERTKVRSKRSAYYFRTTFNAGSTVSAVNGLRISGQIDDGAIVYLNGKEIWRYNMPGGTPTYGMRATKAIGGTAETKWISAHLSKSALKAGINVLAVEVHNNSLTSSDITFDLSLSPR